MDATLADATDLRNDPALLLVEHARWGDGELLDAAAALTDEQLDRPFEMSLGSFRAIVTHTIGAGRSWVDVYRASETRPWLGDEGPFSVTQLRELMTLTYDEWASAVKELDRGKIVERERDGNVLAMSRPEILTHVFTHAAHHRAHCINILRQLGVEPLPTGGLMKWVVDRFPPRSA